jgi:tetratricopeptide (TPR) repeat protein
MENTKQSDSPLPPGWLSELFATVDLERAFLQLRGLKHFWVEAWKGHIRAQQLRFDTAWKYFDKAYAMAAEAEENIPNLVRQFILNIWCFENALAEAPISDSVTDIPESWIPELREEVLEEYPEVRLVIHLRRKSEAWLRLHLGQFTDAAEIFGELIEEYRDEEEGIAALHYLGLAACEYNMEFKDAAVRNLENAGLMVALKGKTWNQVQAAAILQAFYKFLKMDADAASWECFIEKLPCPQATKNLYKKRASLVHTRCLQNSKLILV